ncbi:hypothetical protein SDC9_182033 [bioreactor metagenome]|uniref:Uncharacterized protein n=1 Tax=bioreactor metagenome TaxID=1076179 RepID=A0A645H8X4_9ZZZZ
MQNGTPHFFAVNFESAVPGEVVEAEGVELTAGRVHFAAELFFNGLDHGHFGIVGYVAYAHGGYICGVHAESLGVEPGRVGEVHQHGAWRPHGTDIFSDLENDRDGAQGFGHAANAGGLLPHKSVAQAQVFIFTAGGHLTHAQLGDDVRGAADGIALIGAEGHFKGSVFAFDHAFGKATHDLEPCFINIHQAKLAHR